MANRRAWLAVAIGVLNLLGFLGAAVAAAEGDAPVLSPWRDATGPLATSPLQLWRMWAWPGKDLVIASVGKGLWGSEDGGATWSRLCGEGQGPAQGHSDHVVFDPLNNGSMWCSGMYGFAAWKTTDWGKTFTRLGSESHCEGIAVDFTDPKRATVLLTLHEAARSLRRSSDGGATFVPIGDRFPENTNHNNEVIILDTKTWLVNAAGYLQGQAWGIYRTVDAGQSWTKVSDFGTSGPQTVASDGSIYWPQIWSENVVVSRDRGQTWVDLHAPIKGAPIEYRPGHLVGVGGDGRNQLLESSDAGATWKPLGPVIPIGVRAVIYDAPRRAFFGWSSGDFAKGARIVRSDLAGNPAAEASADALIAKAQQASGSAKRTAALKLLADTSDLFLDDARRKRIDELTSEVASELRDRQSAVREALAADAKDLEKIVAEGRKAFTGTAYAAWFDDATIVAKTRIGVDRVAGRKRPLERKAVDQLLADLQKTRKQITTPELAPLIDAEAARVERLGR